MIYLAIAAAVVALPMAFFAYRCWLANQALALKAGPLGHARPGGMVHVMGRVAPHQELLSSPKLGKECVYYRNLVETYFPARDSKQTPSRHVVSCDEDWVDFVIEDATGRILVRSDGAKFIMEKDFVLHEAQGPKPKTREFLGLQFRDHDNRPVRIETETYIAAGDLVRVVGHAAGSAPRTDTEDPTMVVCKAGSPVFVVSDKPKGKLVDGFDVRAFAYGFGALLMVGIAVACGGIAMMPTPEEDPVPVDRSMKPIERVRRPAAE